MGTDINAFVLLDDYSPAASAPFSGPASFWDLTHDTNLRKCKDYRFYSAIAGVRNDGEFEPLFPPRGPCPLDGMVGRDRIDDELEDCFAVGWLTLAEIHAALTHRGLRPTDLSESISLLLEVMGTIESRYGKDRVRLLFGFD